MHPATINAVSGTIQLIRQALTNIEQIMASDPGVVSQTITRREEADPDNAMVCTTKEEEALTLWIEKQRKEALQEAQVSAE